MALALVTCRIAIAQEFEKAIMPGEVIAGHADLEAECTSCHKRFDRPFQRQLCMNCHEAVRADVNENKGFHGLSPDVRDVQCAVCHTDHIGRDADIVGLVESTFDHDLTDFELVDSHAETKCADCHAPDTLYRDAPGMCHDCHDEDDVHKETLGKDCAECHRPSEWTDATFDHDTTDYPLLGKHKETACLDCHEDSTYQNAPTTCHDCHAEDDAHDGRSGQECEKCHNPSDWHDSSFDHERDTEFPLDGKHAEASCDDCHSEDPFEDEQDKACIACHLEDDEHNKHNGDKCDSCHNSSDWADSQFNHGRDTDYRLLGAHETIACVECHVEPIFAVTLQTTCESCHLDEDPHEETLGTQCENCHTEVNWEDPVFFDHDLTAFPLLGKHAENECDDCHTARVVTDKTTRMFTDIEPDCLSCHREDDPHHGNFDDRCDACHNPVAWDIWTFDHDVQTEFPLLGAHPDVSCDSCHRSTLENMKNIDGSCRSCHRADDVHDGEFGSDCARCHTADSFREVRSLQ